MLRKQLIILTIISTMFILSIGPPLARAYPIHWLPATTNAEWSGRWIHTTLVFDNKIWVLGGLDIDDNRRNDVWFSHDGEGWENTTENAQWSARYGHVSVVFDDKMWVMGGVDDTGFKNDVWYSSDGVNWTLATSNAGWSGRSLPTAVVFDGKMWVMGGLDIGDGYDIEGYKKDVWSSSDGVNWNFEGAAAWSARTLHTSVVFDNKIWVMGGRDGVELDDRQNDVWSSLDGTVWSLETSSAQWTDRTHPFVVAFDDLMWVMGGYTGYAPETDVWYSSNGHDWSLSSYGSAWSPRIGHRAVVFNDKIWMIGGAVEAEFYNDVWFSNPGAIPEIPPAEDPAEIMLPLIGIGFSMMFMGFGYGLTKGKNILAAFVFLDIGFLTFWLLGILPVALVVIGFLILILYVMHERGASDE